MKSFEQKYRVEVSDITPNFGMKPTVILRYLQETFARYCAKHNVAGYDVYEIGLKWVFGKIIVEFFDLIPLWSEEITVRTYISHCQKLRMFVNFEVETKRGLVAKAQSTAYVLNDETSRPESIQGIFDAFNLNREELKGEIIKLNFENNGEVISKYQHKVGLSDIDYNDHTNNISYVSFGLSGLPKEKIVYGFPKLLEIKYLKETFLGDVLDCEIKREGNNFEHVITDSKDNSLACIINSVWDDTQYSREYFIDLIKREVQTF